MKPAPVTPAERPGDARELPDDFLSALLKREPNGSLRTLRGSQNGVCECLWFMEGRFRSRTDGAQGYNRGHGTCR
jgi:hypothetical protein